MSDILHQIDGVAEFFDRIVADHGYSPAGCDYASWATQQQRFDVMIGVDDFKARTVLDIGCGFGDFVDYLNNRDLACAYRGLDISQRMLDTARERHPGIDFARANILLDPIPSADIVIANGIFYLLGADGWKHMQHLIVRLFELAERSLAFSSLSTAATQRSTGEFYADPASTFAFCRTLTPWVTLRHDYHPGDFSMYMYRERHR